MAALSDNDTFALSLLIPSWDTLARTGSTSTSRLAAGTWIQAGGLPHLPRRAAVRSLCSAARSERASRATLIFSFRATARRLRGAAVPMPARRSSSLCPRGFNLDTQLLRRTTTFRSRSAEVPPRVPARAEWAGGELLLAGEVVVGGVTVDTPGVRALGAAGVLDVGVDVTGGVTTGLTGGAGRVGVGVGAVTAGAGAVWPGTVMVIGETAGVVAAGFVAAPLGRDSMANIVSRTTVSRMPTKIGRRPAAWTGRAAASTHRLLVSAFRTLDVMSLPPTAHHCAGAGAPPPS
jgi:hypothetical protein